MIMGVRSRRSQRRSAADAVFAPLPGRWLPQRAERVVAHARQGWAVRGKAREHGLRAVEARLRAERREQRTERLPPRARLARRLHRRPKALPTPGVAGERAVALRVRAEGEH